MDRSTISICVWTSKRKNSVWKRKENCKMNELDIRGCKRWTRPDLKIRNSQTRAVNEWGIGIFSKIYNDHIYSPTQPAYAGPQGQPMELQGLKISDIVHIFLGDNHVAVESLPLACCKTQTLSKWIWIFFYKLSIYKLGRHNSDFLGPFLSS